MPCHQGLPSRLRPHANLWQARGLYYADNTFWFTLTHHAQLDQINYHLKHWLRAIGVAQRSLARRIYLETYYDCQPGASAKVVIQARRRHLKRTGINIPQAQLAIDVRGRNKWQTG